MSQVVLDPRGVDLDVSRYSQGSTASSITLGGENYPIGSKVGTSGLFVIGDPNYDAPKKSSSTRSSITTLSQPTGSSNYLLNEGYDFEDWNWPVVRFSCLAMLLAIMVGLLAAVVALAVQGQAACNLDLDWWQGSVIYHINVGKFFDSNHDEIGDIKGIKNKLDYLEYLGVGVVCLNHFLPSLRPGFEEVTSFRDVDSRLGTTEDIQVLAAALHNRGMRLMLEFEPVWTSDTHDWFKKSRVQSATTGNKYKDVYIWRGSRPFKDQWMWALDPLRNQFYHHLNNSEHPLLNWANLRTAKQFEEELRYWLDLGVDGIYIRSIEKFEQGSDSRGQYGAVLRYLSSWRNLVNSFKSTLGARIIMVDSDYIAKVEREKEDLLAKMLQTVHLVNTRLHLNVANLSYTLQGEVNAGLKWQQMGHAWVSWHVGAFEKHVPQSYVAALEMFIMVLPGTPALYAGQEVGIDPYDTSYTGTHVQLIQWSTPGSGQLSQPYKKGSILDITTMGPLRAVSKLRQKEPTLRGDIDGHTQKDDQRVLNIKFLEVDSALIFLKRFYYKRNKYFYAMNLGNNEIVKDWSATTSAGFYKADTAGGLRGSVTMNSIQIKKGQGIVFFVPV